MFGSEARVWVVDDRAFLLALIPIALLVLITLVSLLERQNRAIRLLFLSREQQLRAKAITERVRILAPVLVRTSVPRARTSGGPRVYRIRGRCE